MGSDALRARVPTTSAGRTWFRGPHGYLARDTSTDGWRQELLCSSPWAKPLSNGKTIGTGTSDLHQLASRRSFGFGAEAQRSRAIPRDARHPDNRLARAGRRLPGVVPQLPGRHQQAGRNLLSGPADVSTDAAIPKDIPLREPVWLQLRGELFNTFTQVNFGSLNASPSSTSFGRILGADAEQTVQLVVKLLW